MCNASGQSSWVSVDHFLANTKHLLTFTVGCCSLFGWRVARQNRRELEFCKQTRWLPSMWVPPWDLSVLLIRLNLYGIHYLNSHYLKERDIPTAFPNRGYQRYLLILFSIMIKPMHDFWSYFSFCRMPKICIVSTHFATGLMFEVVDDMFTLDCLL